MQTLNALTRFIYLLSNTPDRFTHAEAFSRHNPGKVQVKLAIILYKEKHF